MTRPGLLTEAQVAQAIAAYLDAEADKTPRARVRARTLRIAADAVRAGLWRNDDAPPS